MAIIGMSFNSVEGRREKPQEIKSEIKVNSSPVINDIREITLSTLGKKVLSMDFEFRTAYDPKVGEIKIGSELLYLTDKNKEILKKWEKEKKLPDNVSLEVINYLFRKCLLKVSTIAEDLQLPPPIPMPTVKPKK